MKEPREAFIKLRFLGTDYRAYSLAFITILVTTC